jgi:hypothetical protein
MPAFVAKGGRGEKREKAAALVHFRHATALFAGCEQVADFARIMI